MISWDVVVEIIKTAGVVGAATSICLGYFTLRKEYGWRRKKFTVDLFLRSLDDQSRSNLALLARAYPQLLASNPGRGPEENECQEILSATPGRLIREEFDGFELRRAIMAQFNSIEPIAMAYNHKLVDLEAIDRAVGTVILRRYDFFLDFIRTAEALRGDHPWPSIPKLVQDLKQRRGER